MSSPKIDEKSNDWLCPPLKGLLPPYELKPPAPKPVTSDSDGFYRVVVGSYKDKDNAIKQQEKLKKAGFDSFLDFYKK